MPGILYMLSKGKMTSTAAIFISSGKGKSCNMCKPESVSGEGLGKAAKEGKKF